MRREGKKLGLCKRGRGWNISFLPVAGGGEKIWVALPPVCGRMLCRVFAKDIEKHRKDQKRNSKPFFRVLGRKGCEFYGKQKMFRRPPWPHSLPPRQINTPREEEGMKSAEISHISDLLSPLIFFNSAVVILHLRRITSRLVSFYSNYGQCCFPENVIDPWFQKRAPLIVAWLGQAAFPPKRPWKMQKRLGL